MVDPVCGRTALAASPDDLREAFGLEDTPQVSPQYNVPPSAPVHAVRVLRNRPGRRLESLRWGLVPPWADDLRVGHRLALARVETVATAPAFRGAVRHRRCLVAVDGFYEWQHAGKRTSRPFFVRRHDGKPFALAAIWERWTSNDGEVIESCAILTQPARPPVDTVHDRMPLVLEPESWDAWLDPSLVDPASLTVLLRTRDPELVAFAVSSRVNDPRFDDPACLEPATDAQLGLPLANDRGTVTPSEVTPSEGPSRRA
jgi:putative SOS response-associated peptidase YedK